jgi:hypothetical protein
MPHAQTGETPYIQRCHFGAAFALVARTTVQTASRVEWLMDLTAATRLFFCARSLPCKMKARAMNPGRLRWPAPMNRRLYTLVCGLSTNAHQL